MGQVRLFWNDGFHDSPHPRTLPVRLAPVATRRHCLEDNGRGEDKSHDNDDGQDNGNGKTAKATTTATTEAKTEAKTETSHVVPGGPGNPSTW